MANAKRDSNRVTVGLAVTDDANKTLEPLKVDTSTKRLIVEISGSSPPTTSDPTGKRDANRVPTAYGVTDDANLTPVPIATDSNGFLLADVNVE